MQPLLLLVKACMSKLCLRSKNPRAFTPGSVNGQLICGCCRWGGWGQGVRACKETTFTNLIGACDVWAVGGGGSRLGAVVGLTMIHDCLDILQPYQRGQGASLKDRYFIFVYVMLIANNYAGSELFLEPS
ncbi:hypothetical protein NIES2109_58590 (plasmid) [Nostoc sp. HK-01]|nr:hypothetical protein NIES2109_58590 [Nostoc sp. HK-01]